jgi:hypothetical protein
VRKGKRKRKKIREKDRMGANEGKRVKGDNEIEMERKRVDRIERKRTEREGEGGKGGYGESQRAKLRKEIER